MLHKIVCLYMHVYIVTFCIFSSFCSNVCNLYAVLVPLLLKSSLLHIILYFEKGLYITFTYYLEIKVTSNILD